MVNVPVARILVIDDNPAIVDILVTFLRGKGYGMLGALTGDEGLKLVSVSRPDLVLLDILMPGMNGIEVLKRIRSINPTTKVIIVTGNADFRLAREALELGAVAYVDKPFDLADLKRMVALALRSETETT